MKSLLIAALMLSTAAVAAEDKPSMANVSARLVAEASTLEKAGKLAEAQFALERALVAAPENAAILLRLGEIHEAQGRTGKGLKYYRNALIVDPSLKSAMEHQALAFLKRNLLIKAELVTDRLTVLCETGCSELDTINAAIKEFRAKKEAALTAKNDEAEKDESKQ